MKTFITCSKFESIVKKHSDIQNIQINGEIYKKPIYFFSKYELKTLFALKSLFENPSHYFKKHYVPIKKEEDSLRFLFENKSNPSYHLNNDCKRLNSEYENYEIPLQIRELGKDAVCEFRDSVKNIIYLFENDKLAFKMRFDIICKGLVRKYSEENWQEINLEKFIKDNSGLIDLENLSAKELEKLIDDKIKEAGRYYYANKKNTIILKRFSRASHLAYINDPIKDNNTGYSDLEVKEFLKDYDEKFKKPLKKLLIQYYMIISNTDLSIDNKILEELGFKVCKTCQKNEKQEKYNESIQNIKFELENLSLQ